MPDIRRLTGQEARRHLNELAAVLVDCVEGGASVSFMPPFSLANGIEFFERVIEGVEQGNRILLAAFVDGVAVGTVQVVFAQAPNQPHRGDIAKLLVARAARGQRLSGALMERAESEAKAAGKTLLVLDTCAEGVAERLYTKLGWTRAGVIPNYALMPDGSTCDTVIFWKALT